MSNTAHALPDEDSIYSGTLPGSSQLRFFKLHRIGNTYHLYIERDQRTKAASNEDKYVPTGQTFECRPEAANEALIRAGFKYYAANWWQE